VAFFPLRPGAHDLPLVRRVTVNMVSSSSTSCWLSATGQLNVSEIPLNFQARIKPEDSKLDLGHRLGSRHLDPAHPVWLRAIPRRAISFALVGATGVVHLNF